MELEEVDRLASEDTTVLGQGNTTRSVAKEDAEITNSKKDLEGRCVSFVNSSTSWP
jgi:hypothetical protein